ncbi:phosphorylase family protein [Streptomyces sp. NPDC002643]
MIDSEPAAVSYARCRRAARAVRAAEYGRRATATVRGEGVSCLLPARGPLALLLYVAGREGRLVWQNERGFMVLEPPPLLSRRFLGAGAGLRFLRLVDRHWQTLLFAAPPALALVCAASLLPFPDAHLAVLLLALAALVYITVFMAALVLTGGRALWRSFGAAGAGPRAVAESLAGRHWTVPLCHQQDAHRTDELLRRTTARLRTLVAVRAETAAADLGFQVQRGESAETLVVLRRGITTEAVRRRLDAHGTGTADPVGAASTADPVGGTGTADPVGATSTADPVEVLVLHPPSTAPDPSEGRVVSGSFLLWYVSAATAVVLVGAQLVVGWERAECPDECPGRPVTYGSALRWLSHRLLLSEPADLTPATVQTQTIGWLLGVMALMAVPVTVVAVRQQAKALHRATEPHRRLNRRMMPTKLLLVVATAEERDAVFRSVAAVNGTGPERRRLGDHTVFALGRISDADLYVVQSEQASGGPSGSALVVSSVLDRLAPDYLIAVGICCGTRPGKQELGHVLVSTQLRMMDHRRVGDADGQPLVVLRGDKVSASGVLLDRLRAAEIDWTGAKVHFGLMLSSSVLIDFAPLRDRMVAEEPDALGAEMEGGGVYAAATGRHVPWIVVKAVSDWGEAKTDTAQPPAARNAADFVVHMVTGGALDPQPEQSTHAGG